MASVKATNHQEMSLDGFCLVSRTNSEIEQSLFSAKCKHVHYWSVGKCRRLRSIPLIISFVSLYQNGTKKFLHEIFDIIIFQKS